MRVTIALDGTVTIETEDVNSAVELVHKLRKVPLALSPAPTAVVVPTARSEAKKSHHKKVAKKLAPPKPDRKLSRQLEQSWTFIATHDTGTGISAPEMADALKITTGAAGQRFLQLMAKDMVHRVSMGRYSVGPYPEVEKPHTASFASDGQEAPVNGLAVSR